jgi:hypothetical protein
MSQKFRDKHTTRLRVFTARAGSLHKRREEKESQKIEKSISTMLKPLVTLCYKCTERNSRCTKDQRIRQLNLLS